MLRALLYRGKVAEAQVLDLDVEQLGALRRPRNSLVWVDCEAPDERETAALASAFDLHAQVVEDFRHGGQRTKFDHYPDQYHVAVHDCGYDGAALYTREIDVVFGTGWLVTVRERSSDFPDGFPLDAVRARFEAERLGQGGRDLGFLLWALLDVVVDRYFAVTDHIDDRLDDLEVILLDDTADQRRLGQPQELFELSKALLHFRRMASPLREVVAAMLRHEAACIDPSTLPQLQDVFDHVLRITDFVESQRDIVTGLRDAQLAVTSNQMSLVQQRIAAWGAVLIVATLVTGFLGMNFHGAPELSWEEGFFVIFGVIVLLCLPLYAYFRRKRWL